MSGDGKALWSCTTKQAHLVGTTSARGHVGFLQASLRKMMTVRTGQVVVAGARVRRTVPRTTTAMEVMTARSPCRSTSASSFGMRIMDVGLLGVHAVVLVSRMIVVKERPWLLRLVLQDSWLLRGHDCSNKTMWSPEPPSVALDKARGVALEGVRGVALEGVRAVVLAQPAPMTGLATRLAPRGAARGRMQQRPPGPATRVTQVMLFGAPYDVAVVAHVDLPQMSRRIAVATTRTMGPRWAVHARVAAGAAVVDVADDHDSRSCHRV